MKKKIRFPKALIWGSIAFLLFVVAGCSFPMDPASEPSSREETEESSEQDSGEDQQDEEGEQDSDEEQDGDQDSGGEQDSSEDGDGEDGEQETPIPVSIRIGVMEKPEGIYPDLGGITQYRLDFFGENGKTTENLYLEADEEIAVNLDPGEWEIRVYGILTRGEGQPPLAVISGTTRVTVSKNETETVLIVPDGPAAESEEQGFLSWDIDYPEGNIWEAVLTVSLKIDEDSFVPYRYFDLTVPGAKEQRISLPAGTYKMESRFLSHNVNTGPTETVHIFPGLETGTIRVTIPGDRFPSAEEFSSVNDLKAYLDTLPENTADEPYPVKVTGVDLSSKKETGDNLKTLYDALSRYVTLDLRECTGTDLIVVSIKEVQYRPNIVSLILPDSITTIATNGFFGYENLKLAVLPKVTTIMHTAFSKLEKLETVFAPELTALVDSTISAPASNGNFHNCIALNSIYFPKLEITSHHAFYGCSGLTEAAFPNLRTVGEFTFKGCTALKSVNLPSVTKIDKGSFESDTALTHLILGSTPPELGENVFKVSDFSQSGVIYVPPDAVDAYKNTTLPNWSRMTELVRPLSGLVDL